MYKLFAILLLSFSIVLPTISAATAGDRNYRNDRFERHDDRREWRRDRRERRHMRRERRERRVERHERRREWRQERRHERREWRRDRREWRRDRRDRWRDRRHYDRWSYYENDNNDGAIAAGAIMLGILGTAIILDGLNDRSGPQTVEIPCKGMDAAREMERCPIGHTRVLENR